ncbi:Nonsense-mediated mRNA decay 2 protein [Ceraceosorus bombacis]|uniref:Nonsense-mediated mRNA decay 2 protein n=1 Tax=Ceraceosorus bombacis TaxID=401625 RepID=A0A0P1BAD4_9BASI|nr:Nonsense-mediated mRNA decay 2 protein [Ceraceosorus bombacis]
MVAEPEAGVSGSTPTPAPTTAAAAGRAPVATSAIKQERDRRRHQLRTVNASLWGAPARQEAPNLDSNLKKNTAFIKRLRAPGLVADAKEGLLKDLTSLKVEKYVEEIVQAIPEGLGRSSKEKDVAAASEIVSALHTRFAPDAFALPLSALLASQLAPPNKTALAAQLPEARERDESSRLARQKVLLRAAAELSLVQVLRGSSSTDTSDAGMIWLFGVVKELFSTDREHANVPLAISLLKGIGSTLIGTAAPSSSGTVPDTAEPFAASGGTDAASSTETETQLLSPEWRERFRKLFETYFATLVKHIAKDHARLQEQDKRNHEAYIRSGEIFEDRQQNYERMTKSFEKLYELGKSLADLLDVPIPALSDSSTGTGIGLAINLDARTAPGDQREDTDATGKSPWEDEDSRRFYEETIDLLEMVPVSLLGKPAGRTSQWTDATEDKAEGQGHDKAVAGIKEDKAAGVGEDPAMSKQHSPATSPVAEASDAALSPVLSSSALSDAIAPLEADNADRPINSKDQQAPDEALSSGPAAQLAAILARLPEMTNRTMIDSAAVEFAFVNSKGARKRLIKQLCTIPKNRHDLIPYYSRLIATLDPYMSDVAEGVVAVLNDEFRYCQKKRNIDLRDLRAKNMTYIGELTKFKIAPIHTIFYCLRVCLEDFSGYNIQNIATFLETCGRFLLRTPQTSQRMQSMMELLRRKRAATNLNHQQVMLLDNAYFQSNPPDRSAVVQKERAPMELFVRHLIYDMLTKKTLDKVLKLLRKLHWENAQVVQWIHECFTRAWRIKYSNLHLLAILVHDLQPYHPDFAVHVVDTVCEQLRVGMETNIFKLNQRRVTTIAYLGEMYNYRLVSSDLIFDHLWSMTTFGHPGGHALPGQVCRIDAPDDYFRIRLICALLDTCGHCFDRGSLKRRLDDFLVYFNVYVLSKERPLPMDIDFMLQDTLEVLRPTFVLKTSYEEAVQAADQMFAAQQRAPPAQAQDQSVVDATTQQAGQAGLQAEAEEPESSDDEADTASPHSTAARLHDESGSEHSLAHADADETIDAADEGAAGEEADDVGRGDSTEATAEQEAEEELERELAKMMAEGPGLSATGAPRSAQRNMLDDSLPFLRRPQQTAGGLGKSESEQASSRASDTTNGTHMRFSLLSRKGNKQQTRNLDVPADSAIAIATRAKQLQEQAERQHLKHLVLRYEVMQDAAERKALADEMGNRGIKLTYVDKG